MAPVVPLWTAGVLSFLALPVGILRATISHPKKIFDEWVQVENPDRGPCSVGCTTEKGPKHRDGDGRKNQLRARGLILGPNDLIATVNRQDATYRSRRKRLKNKGLRRFQIDGWAVPAASTFESHLANP
jgi:hypothetical protein